MNLSLWFYVLFGSYNISPVFNLSNSYFFFLAGETLYTFTILTTASSSALQWLHG